MPCLMLVVCDAEHARPSRPVGTVIEVLPDGADAGLVSSRCFLRVRLTDATPAQARAEFLQHDDWDEVDGPPSRVRRFRASQIPTQHRQRVRAYLQMRADNAEDIKSRGRAAMRAEAARFLKRGLTAEERSERSSRFIDRFLRKHPRVYDRLHREYREKSRARRMELEAPLPLPGVISLTLQQALNASRWVNVP